MPPHKRPGPKEPLYTISWPPLKLQFQFDHTRRVVDARSRIDAIQTGPVENYSLRKVNEPGLQYDRATQGNSLRRSSLNAGPEFGLLNLQFLIFVAIIRPSNLNPMLLMMRGKFRELTCTFKARDRIVPN